jgi:hypothetical protein
MARSSTPTLRVAIWYSAVDRAEVSDSSMAQWKLPVPGWMMSSTPMKPTRTANQRRGPTRSPSSSGDRAQTHSGLEKAMEEVWASWR